MNNYSNGIISKPNITAGNPYGVNRTFIARVSNNEKFGTVQIPLLNQQQGIEMQKPDNLYETNNAINIEENSYYIDYAAQIIYFNAKQIGQEVIFDAYDMGEDLILDHKICTLLDNNGNPIETLKSIIEKGFESLDYLNIVGSAVEITELLKAEIENGKSMVSNIQEKIIVGGVTTTQLINATNEAKGVNASLTNTNTNAKNTDESLRNGIVSANNINTTLSTSTTNAENKRAELLTTTTNANTSKTQLQTVITDSSTKKNELQVVIDDSVVKKNQLQTVIGQADIPTMKQDITANAVAINTLKNDVNNLHQTDIALLAEIDKLKAEMLTWTNFRDGGGNVGGVITSNGNKVVTNVPKWQWKGKLFNNTDLVLTHGLGTRDIMLSWTSTAGNSNPICEILDENRIRFYSYGNANYSGGEPTIEVKIFN